jgi:hypothetical protein
VSRYHSTGLIDRHHFRVELFGQRHGVMDVIEVARGQPEWLFTKADSFEASQF